MTTPNLTPQKLTIVARFYTTDLPQIPSQNHIYYRESHVDPGICGWMRMWRLCTLLVHTAC
ncbi:hypothetical protein PGB90_006478 [Kerria lacca]